MTTGKRVHWIVKAIRQNGERVVIRKNISQQEAYRILNSLHVGVRPHTHKSASATPMEEK